MSKFAKAVAARETAAVTPAPSTNGATMKTTVTLTRHTRTELTKTFADLGLKHGCELNIGPVGAILYEMFLADPGIQQEVITRLK